MPSGWVYCFSGSLLFSGQNYWWDTIYPQISLTLVGQAVLLALTIFVLKFIYFLEIWISYLQFFMWFPYAPTRWMGLVNGVISDREDLMFQCCTGWAYKPWTVLSHHKLNVSTLCVHFSNSFALLESKNSKLDILQRI